MKVTITIKLQPESDKERIDSYQSQYALLKEHVEGLREAGMLPPCEFRWLLITKVVPPPEIEKVEVTE